MENEAKGFSCACGRWFPTAQQFAGHFQTGPKGEKICVGPFTKPPKGSKAA